MCLFVVFLDQRIYFRRFADLLIFVLKLGYDFIIWSSFVGEKNEIFFVLLESNISAELSVL